MPLPKHPLSAVVEADLRRLVDDGAREDRTLEFKRESYAGSDDARAEFLADVSALANTLGGDIVLGIDEEQGVATALPGLGANLDADQEILRLTQMAQSGLQPRLAALEMWAVPLAKGGSALVIRVGHSYQGPHRVTFKGRNRFWARSGAGRYEPDVAELRALFSAAPELAARLRDLRSDRVARVIAGETPVKLEDVPGVVIMHIIPLAAAAPFPAQVDLERLRSQTSAWFPWGGSGYNERRNFDGFVTFPGQEGQAQRSYLQVFRNGMVEVAASGIVESKGGQPGQRRVAAEHLAKRVLHQLRRVLPALRGADVDPPYSVQLTMAGVRGSTFEADDRKGWRILDPALPVERDVLSFTDALVGENDVTPGQLATALRPMLDQLFQTAGHHTTPWFNADGSLPDQWIGP